MAPKLLVAVLLAGERAAELGGPWVACRRPAQGGAGALHVPPLAPCIGGKTRPALVASGWVCPDRVPQGVVDV